MFRKLDQFVHHSECEISAYGFICDGTQKPGSTLPEIAFLRSRYSFTRTQGRTA